MHSCLESLFHANQFPLPFPIHFLNTLIQVYMILVHFPHLNLKNVLKEHLIRLSKLWKLRPISHINVAMDQLSFPDTWRRHLVPSFNMLVVMTRVIVSCLFFCWFGLGTLYGKRLAWTKLSRNAALDNAHVPNSSVAPAKTCSNFGSATWAFKSKNSLYVCHDVFLFWWHLQRFESGWISVLPAWLFLDTTKLGLWIFAHSCKIICLWSLLITNKLWHSVSSLCFKAVSPLPWFPPRGNPNWGQGGTFRTCFYKIARFRPDRLWKGVDDGHRFVGERPE